MMPNQEDKLEIAMRADARCITQEQQPLSTSAQIYAIQQGLQHGKRRGNKWLFVKSISAAAVVAALALGVMLISPLKEAAPPGASQIPQAIHWGVLTPFVSVAPFDDGQVENALNNDYVQHLNASAEKDGYQITINAVIADENELILLYTARTDSKQDIYSVSSSKLSDASTGAAIGIPNGGNRKSGARPTEDNHIYYGRTTLALDRSTPPPDQVLADFQIASVDPGKLEDYKTGTVVADMRYSPRLKVNFSIDPKFWENKTKILTPKQPIIVDGHKITIEVELSPLRTIVRYKMDKALNADFQLKRSITNKLYPIELLSLVGKTEVPLVQLSGSGTEEGYVITSSSNILDHPGSLRLKFKALPDNQEITMDLKEAVK